MARRRVAAYYSGVYADGVNQEVPLRAGCLEWGWVWPLTGGSTTGPQRPRRQTVESPCGGTPSAASGTGHDAPISQRTDHPPTADGESGPDALRGDYPLSCNRTARAGFLPTGSADCQLPTHYLPARAQRAKRVVRAAGQPDAQDLRPLRTTKYTLVAQQRYRGGSRHRTRRSRTLPYLSELHRNLLRSQRAPVSSTSAGPWRSPAARPSEAKVVVTGRDGAAARAGRDRALGRRITRSSGVRSATTFRRGRRQRVYQESRPPPATFFSLAVARAGRSSAVLPRRLPQTC